VLIKADCNGGSELCHRCLRNVGVDGADTELSKAPLRPAGRDGQSMATAEALQVSMLKESSVYVENEYDEG
jgi:hypothetical protein